MVEYISILPQGLPLSSTHRYLRLPHPRTGLPQLYLPYESDGRHVILEVVRLNGAKRRTWFIGDSTIDSGTMLIHHPIDPLFLVIPIVLSLLSHTNSFQPLSDLISTASSSSTFSLPLPFTRDPGSSTETFNEDISRLLAVPSVRRAFRLCCERKVVPPTGDEEKPAKYYRPSRNAILRLIDAKIRYFADPQRFECFDHLVRAFARDGLSGHLDSELVDSARIKTSIDHFSQYLPPALTSTILQSHDFTRLNDHLANRTAAIMAAQAPNISNKSKAVTGVKRKAPAASRGVEQLKKVNTSSMAKLTSFFKPGPGKT